MKYNKWTIESTKKLQILIKDNPQTTIRELSELMGYTVATIQKKMEKFRYRKGWYRDEKVQ